MLLLLSLLALIVLLGIVSLIKNELTFQIRTKILFGEGGLTDHDKLPNYGAMMFDPTCWTLAQTKKKYNIK